MKKRLLLILLLATVLFAGASVGLPGHTVATVATDDTLQLKRTIRNLEEALLAKQSLVAELSTRPQLSEQEMRELKNARADIENIGIRIREFSDELALARAGMQSGDDSPGVALQETDLATPPTGMIPTDAPQTQSPAEPSAPKGTAVTDDTEIGMTQFTLKVGGGQKVFNIADVDDAAHVYGECQSKKNTWLVVSKREFRVYVYEAVGGDTLLRATFPVCYARNSQDKTRTGDSCTPESRDAQTPFTISQIQDASTWRHTFKNDPRGNILAYGPFFMRLKLTGSKVPGNTSIGIHGCGGYDGRSNSYSVPGRDSEGCLRLRDNDLKTLRTKYCDVGTRVFIKSATAKKFPYELRSAKNCAGYQPATFGNPLAGKTKTL